MTQRPKTEVQTGGFTLIELVIVVAILGITAGVAIPVIGNFIESSKVAATKDEMQRLARALSGSADHSDRGFEGDVGFLPSSLSDLASKPGSVAVWNPYQDIGWNGPYIDATDGNYLTDAWDQSYIYDPSSRILKSTGGGDTITLGF